MTSAPNDKRLIEVAFPLREASLDSVHEKNVRHGHISTLHIWPARRPLAACRAALIATLLPDPGNDAERKRILEKLAGRIVPKIEKRKFGGRTIEVVKEQTEGGILHWGRETSPDLQWFREEIRKAYGGRAPRVLDPFAGGGAIPLEAMRLGCEVTAIDINPVAWFILKCTLEYPQKLAGQTRPLPDFALKDRDFMRAFLEAKGYKGAILRTFMERLGLGDGTAVHLGQLFPDDPTLQADLAWHVRAWGRRVLAEARKRLAARYPTYAEFVALKPGKDYGAQPIRLLETDADGQPILGPLNAGFDEAYLKDPRNPRWVAKPTVAYLWARTVACKNCRALLPLLKTRWLCKKDNKRVLLTVAPNAGRTGPRFGIEADVPVVGGNAAQRREHDKRIGAGTMSRKGATCPCCGQPSMTMEDIRLEGRAGRLGATMTAVVVDGPNGKEYRLPTEAELKAADVTEAELEGLYADIPFGLPNEPTPKGGSGAARAFSVDGYGFDAWRKLFTHRQLLALGSFAACVQELPDSARRSGCAPYWTEALQAFAACALDRLADRGSQIATWQTDPEKMRNTFARFALPITWDYAEGNPFVDSSGGFVQAVEWVGEVLDHTIGAQSAAPQATVQADSAIRPRLDGFDAIVTDPPYYDAIPYSDLMDFFYIWLRRAIGGEQGSFGKAFAESLGPKWSSENNDGELIDDASRFHGDKAKSKANYEDGMARAFQSCGNALTADGRLVVVFANKQPDAWETLVSGLIRSGFVVDGSWPIQTERAVRTRSLASAALSSSVWLVCRKRPATARPGWDTVVLKEMQANIAIKLRAFWDAGIRGPDFVWAATGPALEAYSKHPIVFKTGSASKEPLGVSEFLREVRRLVVDFVVGRVLTHDSAGEEISGLDDVTTYYLLHRHDFGLDDAPIGACILYALSCNLSDSALAGAYDLLAQSGKGSADEEGAAEDENAADDEADEGGGGGAKVRLKAWNQRKGRNLGIEAPGGRPPPLIDQIHRLMHLWKAGEQMKVDDYLDRRGLKRNALFNQVLQALIELSPAASEERSILESLSNHVGARAGFGPARQTSFIP